MGSNNEYVHVSAWTQTLEASTTGANDADNFFGRKIQLDYPVHSVTGVYDNVNGTGTNYWDADDVERQTSPLGKFIVLGKRSGYSASTSYWVTYQTLGGHYPVEGGFGTRGMVGYADIMSVEAGPQAFLTEMTNRNTGIPIRLAINPQAGGMVVKSVKVVTDGADIDMYVYSDSGTAQCDTYATGNQDTDQAVGNDTIYAAGQSFTGDGAELRNAVLWLKAVSSPTGNAVCKLYASTGSDPNRTPTGSVLVTSNSVDVSGIGATYEAVTFTFSIPYTLTSGTYYFLVLEYDGDSSNYLHWGTDTSTPTHANNNFATYTSSWSAAATTDGCFTVNSGKNPTDASIIYQHETVNKLWIDNSVWVVDDSLTEVWVGYVDNATATPASTTIELRGGPLI